MACFSNILSKPIVQVASDCASSFVKTTSNIVRPIASQGKIFSNGVYNYGLEGAKVFVPAALILGSGIYCGYKGMAHLQESYVHRATLTSSNESHQLKHSATHINKSIVYTVAALALTVIGIANMGIYLQSAYRFTISL